MKVVNEINSIIPEGEALVILNNIRSLDFTVVTSKKLTQDETLIALSNFIKHHQEAFDADAKKFSQELADIKKFFIADNV